MTTLVVGVDGSADSVAALRWCAAAAGPSGTVHAVHALRGGASELLGDASAGPDGPVTRAQDALLALWRDQAGGVGGTFTATVVDGDPVAAIGDVAGRLGAAAVAVGARGRSAAVPLNLGRVSAALLRRSALPVVVARDGAAGLSDGPVVVGVGRGSSTAVAVRWAVSMAATTGRRLLLVQAVGHPTLRGEGLAEVLAHTIDPAALRDWADEDLAELAAELRHGAGAGEAGDPGGEPVAVDWHAESGSVGSVLVEQAGPASMVVVGRRRGIVADRLVPLSMRRLATTAPCPVVLVPSHDGG